ncbi:MAG TPA: hypothetical protein VJJ83_04825, partial [Candidatus Babeliales bacterium]|nr:hypothetical protein [Candidatus Babeliales bacterium]
PFVNNVPQVSELPVTIAEPVLTYTVRCHPNPAIITRLLAAGANINQATIYVIASTSSSSAYTYNGVPQMVTKYHNTAGLGIFAEVATISEPIFALLISQPLTPVTRQQALLAACRLGYVAAIDFLIAAGANPNEIISTRKHGDQLSALSFAASNEQVAAMMALLRHNVDVNQIIRDGSCHDHALLKAITSYVKGDLKVGSKLSCLDALIAAGADVNAASFAYNSPLELAVEHDAIAIMRLLIRAHANVNTLSKSGHSLLMLAKSPAATAELLNAGANIDIQDMAGKTALDYATSPAQVRMLKLAAAPSNHTAVSSEPGIEMVPLYRSISFHFARDAYARPDA